MNVQDSTSSIILVVEDQETISILITHLLTKAGYQTELASNGQEALGKLKEGLRPTLILLDVIMPIMDGYEFLDAKHEDEELEAIPVIMLTGLGHAQDIMKALKLGAKDYCTKPIDPDDLLATVKRVLSSA